MVRYWCAANTGLQGGLGYDTPVLFNYDNEYHGENDTRAEELWDSISTDHIAVALTDSWIDEKGLQRSAADIESARFPWDPSRGLYFLKVFYQLHCLVSHVLMGQTRSRR